MFISRHQNAGCLLNPSKMWQSSNIWEGQ